MVVVANEEQEGGGRKEGRQATNMKSNNLHLGGGEQPVVPVAQT